MHALADGNQRIRIRQDAGVVLNSVILRESPAKNPDRPVEPHEDVATVHICLGEVGPHADCSPQQLQTSLSLTSQPDNVPCTIRTYDTKGPKQNVTTIYNQTRQFFAIAFKTSILIMLNLPSVL